MAVVEDKDLGYERIISGLKELDGATIVVGVLRNAGREIDGADLVDVAVWNEYGTRRIPSRPFLRIATDENGESWQELAEKGVNGIIAGTMGKQQVLDLVGVKAVGDIQKVIGSNKLKPNAEATIRRKGSEAPLIDTDRLRQSIHYHVED